MVELLVYITLMLCDTANCFVAVGTLAETFLFVVGGLFEVVLFCRKHLHASCVCHIGMIILCLISE